MFPPLPIEDADGESVHEGVAATLIWAGEQAMLLAPLLAVAVTVGLNAVADAEYEHENEHELPLQLFVPPTSAPFVPHTGSLGIESPFTKLTVETLKEAMPVLLLSLSGW